MGKVTSELLEDIHHNDNLHIVPTEMVDYLLGYRFIFLKHVL